MERTIRYQGAILSDDCVLLIRYRDPQSERTFWMIPGGGLQPEESEEECVRREMQEETNLLVRVERLLFEDDDLGGAYQRRKTYLCQVDSGAPSPGYEPEFPVPEGYGIIATGWFHLGQPETWGDEVHQDSITASILRRIQRALGYATAGNEMTFDEFDQTMDRGWRAIAKRGDFAGAAQAIVDYLAVGPVLEEGQRRIAHFHAAQMYAFTGRVEEALFHLPLSLEPAETASSLVLWNDYVAATGAFLRGDWEGLLAARERIAQGPKDNGVVPNLNVVDRLIANFGKPYAQAY